MIKPITADTITDAQIQMLFEEHCECRPADPERLTHSHDCDTGYTDVCRTARYGNLQAREQCAIWINEKITALLGDRSSPHLIEGLDGRCTFQSDKYPTTPRGKVPLSVEDETAQDLLWEYAGRRGTVDGEFRNDLRVALILAGYVVPRQPELERVRGQRDQYALAIDKMQPVIDAARALCAQPMLVKGDAATWGDVAEAETQGPKLLKALMAAVTGMFQVSRNARKLASALEGVGHTNVKVHWYPLGRHGEPIGGYLFESDQRPGAQLFLGESLVEALSNVPSWNVRRPEIDAANHFASYNRGWTHGAAIRAMADEFMQHPDADIRSAYARGYQAGRDARNNASQDAGQIYGHTPSVLRLAEGKS